MSLTASSPRVGELLRDWRRRRHLSQLDLSIEAEVSSRHLSFVETGRAKPSRELLLHLAEHLEVPLRERNALLLAAGFAPVYRETPMDAEEMAPVRAALDKILAGHEPFPAVAVDSRWDLISANGAALGLLTAGVAPDLLAPRIGNFAEYSAHLLLRLHRQALLTQDPAIADLLDELRGYPGVVEHTSAAVEPVDLLFSPLRIEGPDGGELVFFSTLATFGTAVDITLAELSIEQFFPADAATAAALRG